MFFSVDREVIIISGDTVVRGDVFIVCDTEHKYYCLDRRKYICSWNIAFWLHMITAAFFMVAI